MANFVLAYWAREGSSAIIDMMARQPGVRVPVFEDLDSRNYLPMFRPPELSAVLDYVFSTGTFEARAVRQYLDDKAAGRKVGELRIEGKSFDVGFKWRLFRSKEIASVLLAHNVFIAFLCRRNFVELISSLYLTEDARSSEKLGGRHPQFHLSRMKADEREAFFADADDLLLDVESDQFLALTRRVVDARAKLADHLLSLRDSGIRMKTVFYEDFLTSNQHFLCKLFREIGSIYPPSVFETKYQKVMRRPASEKISNLNAIKESEEFVLLDRRYSEIIGRFAYI